MGIKFSNKTIAPSISCTTKNITHSASHLTYLLFQIHVSDLLTDYSLGRVRVQVQISSDACNYAINLYKINHNTINDLTINNINSYLSDSYSRIDSYKTNGSIYEYVYLDELFNEVYTIPSFDLCFALGCANDLAIPIDLSYDTNIESIEGELFNPSKESYSHEISTLDFGFVGKSNIDLFNNNLFFNLLNISTSDKNPINISAIYNYNKDGLFGKNIKASFEYKIILQASYIEIMNHLGDSSYYEMMDKTYAKSKYNIDATNITGTLYVNVIDFTYIVKDGGIIRLFTKGKDEIRFLQVSTSYGINYNLRIDHIETANGIINYHWNNSILEYIENNDSKVEITYSNGIISRIDYDKERYCLFEYVTYNGYKYLNKIKYCDQQNPLKEQTINATSVYEYTQNSPYMLQYAYDDLTKIGAKLVYNNGLVSEIYTYNKETSEYNNCLSIENSNNVTTISNHLGNYTYYYFDNFGRCLFKTNENCDINSIDFNKYSLISNNKQKISETNKSTIVSNILKNPCFEGDLSDENHNFMWSCGYSFEEFATQFVGYNGRSSLNVDNTLLTDITIYQQLTNPSFYANKTLKFYGYIRGSGTVSINLCVNNVDNITTFTATNTWEKVEVVNVEIPANVYDIKAKIVISQNANVGLCEFTLCEDFMNYGIKNIDNYIVNGGFELNDNGNYLYGWTTNSSSSGYLISNVTLANPLNKIISKELKINGVSLLGDGNITKTFIQEINVQGGAGETLSLSYFAKTNNCLNDICYSFIIVDYLVGGQKSYGYNFADKTNIYHLRNQTITTEAAYKKVIVGVSYKSKNDCYLTAFGFYKEDDTSYYAYNETNSLTDIAKNNTNNKIDYNDDAKVKRYASKSGNVYEYDYLSNGNVSKISDLDGNEFLFSYDDNDNLCKQIIKTSTNKRLILEQESDKNGNILYQKSYDDSVVAYEYDDRERLIKRNSPSGLVERFTYNNKDLLINKKYDINTNTINQSFTYDNKENISTVSITNGTVYNYSLYDEWGSLKNVIIDNNTLNSFTYYKDGYNYTGLLASKIYPNGTYTFIYDEKQRLSNVKFENNDVARYYYDFNDALIKRIDLSGTYYYEYDINGKLINIKNSNNTLKISNEYDNLGSLQQKTYNINGESFNYNYAYKYEYNEYTSGGYFSRLESRFDNDCVFEDVKLKYGENPSMYYIPIIQDDEINKKVFRFSKSGHMISYNTISFNKERSEKSDDNFKYDTWNNNFNNHKSLFFLVKPDTCNIQSQPTVQLLSLASDIEEIGSISYDTKGEVFFEYNNNSFNSIYLKINEWNLIGIELKRNINNTKLVLIVNDYREEHDVSGFIVDDITRIILGKYHSINTTLDDLENEANLPMSFDILYASFGNNSDCIDGHIGIYNDAYKYVFKKNDNKASGVIYYNKDLYSDLDLITLNGSLTSKNGLKPIYYSYGDSSFKLDKTKIFKLDNKKHEDDHYFTNKHVYGSYNDLVGLDGSTKSILAYDFNFKNEGFISFRFKIDKSKELDTDALRTLLCIQKGYGEGEKVLIEIKDNDKVITINYRGLISPINTNITILPDVWHTFSFTWNQLGYKIYVDNQTPFERTGSSLFNFTDSLTFIGCNNVSNQPCDQLNGMIEMFAYGYNYDTNKHNLLKDAKPINHITSYDELERPITKTIETKSIKYNHQYEYYDELVNENNEEYIKVNTKPCVETLEDGTKIIYSYDLSGNVTKQVFIKNNVIIKSLSYKYDALSRLIEEKCFINNNYDYHIEYVYDNNGNILYKTELDSNGEVEYQLEYVYSNAIKDQLTQISVYGREEILLDTININYSNTDPFRPSSYKGNNLTWQGRRLLSYGNNTYTYNSEGIRISKTTSSGTYNYILDDNKIIKETKPNSINVYYHYDEKGMLIGFNYNNNEYFYIRDILGNIIKVVDENNNIKVEYKYNAFGEVLEIIGDNNIKYINSYLYKGYYYDFETCLYYCNSRYYDPNICRWISIDEISYLDSDDINGINLWCYCGNNPVMGYDPDGSWDWKRFFGIAAEILVDALAIAVGISVAAQTGSFELGILSYSIVQNVVNSVYYDCISEGKTELNESSYNIDDKEFRYLTRWERLDYTKNKTGSSTYGINELRYFGEYSTHMWAWGISKWALDKNVPIFSQLAESSRIADVSPTEWESGENEWRNIVYIIVGLLGV